MCINPNCNEVAVNCPKKETSCRNCSSRLVDISNDLYEKKYSSSFWKIDYSKQGYVRITKDSPIESDASFFGRMVDVMKEIL